MLVIDGVKYRLWTPKDEEKEFHPMIKEHAKEIFGKNSLYFDLKKKIVSKTGVGSIPDGYAITLSKPYKWYIVEGELSWHPLYDHVVSQLTKFMNGIKSPRSQREVSNALYEEIIGDPLTRAFVEKMIGSKEIYRFLSNLISEPPTIVVIIEQKDEKVKEACESLRYETKIIEFKTFVREDVGVAVHAHLFEPVHEVVPTPSEIEKVVKKVKRKHPPYRLDWKKRLEWVNDETRDIVYKLLDRLNKELPPTTHSPKYRWYYIYRGKTKKLSSLFAVLLITKKKVNVRIRVDPKIFYDTENITKVMKGWFFRKEGQEERNFSITKPEELDYALDLIGQAYNFAD